MSQIEYGVLICPNCQHKGMDKYKFWSSRLINEYTKQWLFYNKIKTKWEWKCWAIFEICDKQIKIWYDPCNCSFNPFKINKEIKTTDDAKEQLCMAILKFLFLYILFSFIYIGYVFLFLWFDICYFLCYTKKFYEILMKDGQQKTIPIKDGLWKNFETTGYADYFWEENFPNLFKCERCRIAKNTFYNFLKKEGNSTQDTVPQIMNTTVSSALPQ